MPTLTLPDTHLFYTEHGQGLPCLVMHGGLGLDHTYLKPWLDALGDRLHLIYYDHRGNGRSGRPPLTTLTFEQFCDDAEALRKHLDIAEFAILGHSYGGFIAMEYALRYPERVTDLILMNTGASLKFGSPEMVARFEHKGMTPEMWIAFNGPFDNDVALECYFNIVGPIYWHTHNPDLIQRQTRDVIFDVATCMHSLALAAEWNITPRLQQIRARALIIGGDYDVIYPVCETQVLHDNLPDSELMIFENSGHYPYAEEHNAFLTCVKSWLNKSRFLATPLSN